MKTIKAAILNALRANVYNYKFLALFWGLNASLAFILSIPVYNSLIENLNTSALNDRLANGFDYSWYVQFRYLYQTNLSQIPFLIYSTLGVYLLVQQFFVGGLIAVFNNPKKNHVVDFFYGGVKYWVRMTKVFLISLLFFLLAFTINDLLGELITKIFLNSEDIVLEFIIRALRYVVLIAFIAFVMLFSDYLKFNLAIKDHHKMIKGIIETIKLLKKHYFVIIATYLMVNIIGAIGALAYNLIEKNIPRTPYYFLVLLFILQQMLIIFRLFIRMLFYSTGVYLFDELSAEEVSVDSQEELFRNKEEV
jgi:hypothetical protein